MKANRFATNRRVLGEAGESIERFLGSGLAELGPKLGPVVWQFATTKQFDPVDFEAFLKLLPQRLGSLALRHAMEVRHASFMVPEYLSLARRYGVATVFADSDEYPSFADASADFVYARLMKTEPQHRERLSAPRHRGLGGARARLVLGSRARRAGRVAPPAADEARPRDAYLFFISGAKERAPAAAVATLAALGLTPAADDLPT